MKRSLFSMLILLFVGLQSIYAQNREVSGVVTSADDGLSIPGVSVIVKGTTIGTTTDFDGKFALSVPADATMVEFSFVGMQTQSLPITDAPMKVVMQSESIGVEEVMVVAFGTAKKESFTGSAGMVGAEKLEERTLSSVTQALEGSTTGVQVAASSGQPGAAPAIRIRGFGSLNGKSDPLYIVDGAQYEGSMSDISPDDIQSMTILKDASSTALYGSRAANGVVMITTKRGKKNQGKVKINLKVVNGIVSQAIPNYETVGAKDYYELMYQSYKNSLIYGKKKLDAGVAAQTAATGIYSKLRYNPFNVANDKIVGVDGKINPQAEVIARDLDWYKPLEQTGSRQNYNLSASGGGEKHDFYVSLGYLKEKGYVVKSNYERLNSRLNFNATPKDWVKLGTNLSVSLAEQGSVTAGDGTDNNNYSNPFNFARYMGPIYPVYQLNPTTGEYILDANGEKQYDLGGGYSSLGINSRPSAANNGRHVIAELDYNYRKTKTNGISNRSYAEFTIMDGLKVSSNIGLDIQNYRSKKFENEIVGDGAPQGRYSETRYTRTVVNWNQLINYSTTIADDHNLEILLGHESFDRNYSSVSGMKTQMTVKGINEFDNFVTPTSLGGYSSDKTTEGYFGRLKYNFRNKYYVEGSYRRDGSSVFSKDERWGGFFSVGATWRMDQEEFIQRIEWIDQLKVRASYGEVGNDNMGAGKYYASRALYSYNPNAGNTGLTWSKIGNPDLTWESNNSYNAAIEFTVLNNKVRGSLEFYKKISEDLLYYQPLSPSLGLNSQPRNIASLYNQGFEIGLGATIIDKDDFSWDIDVQASTIKNEITDIPSPFINGSKRWAEGHSIYDYYLYDFHSVDPNTGAAMYHVWETDAKGNQVRKYNADGSPVLTTNYISAGKGYTGDSSIPDLFGSISNSLRYKDFQLSFMFTYSIGGKILDYNYASLMNEGEYGRALHVDHKKGWKKKGDITNIPRLENGNSHLAPTSDRWLTDASYLSLKNVNLSYTFKQKKIKEFGINSLKVFASGENLFMLTERKGMNPQQAFSGTTSNVYQPSRVVSFGVNVSF